MKKLLVVLFTLCVCSFAFADGWYVGVDAYYDSVAIEVDSDSDLMPDTFGFTINAGKVFPLPVGALRGEVAVSYSLTGDDYYLASTYEYSNFAPMLNLYYDYTLKSVPITFFPMIGLGMTFHTIENITTGEDDNLATFTWQVGAGVRFNITEKHSVELSFRYVDAGKPEYMDGDGLKTTFMKAGLGYKFWF